jgi:EPS-associated MarR family transcriptional regulator
MPYSPQMSSDDHHLRLLKLIEANPEASQRELARELGVSLGKAHYLVRALLEKGLVKVGDFRRHDRKLAYAYLLTPKGATEKLRLARAYLARREREYEAIRSEIKQLRKDVPA